MLFEGVRVPVLIEETGVIEANLDCSGSVDASPSPVLTKQTTERQQAFNDLIEASLTSLKMMMILRIWTNRTSRFILLFARY